MTSLINKLKSKSINLSYEFKEDILDYLEAIQNKPLDFEEAYNKINKIYEYYEDEIEKI